MLNELRKAEETYKFKKHDLEIRKANLWLNTNWEQVLDKARPTEKDKNAYIDLMLEDRKAEVIAAETEYNYLRRLYKIQMTEAIL